MKYEFNQTKFIKQILSNYSIKLFYQINFIETNLSFISSISFYQFHLRTLHFRTHIANFCTLLMMMAMATMGDSEIEGGLTGLYCDRIPVVPAAQ